MRDELFAAAAIDLLRRAVATHPNDVDLRYDLAEALVDAGHVTEGAALFSDTYRVSPILRPLSLTTAPDDARTIAERTARIAAALVAAGVTYSAVLVARAWSAAVLGDRTTVRRLIDPALCREYVGIATPDGLQRLAAEMIAGMRAHSLPWSAIREARRNSRVFDREEGRRVETRLRALVDGYADAVADAAHPFAQGRPRDYTLRGWSVTFDGASRHISHIHPRAWLSGVLYLRTDAVSSDDHRGWLRVGPPDGIAPECGWDERWVRPEPGKLVLMPSFFPHETMAARSEAARICIAFDVVPRELDFVG